MNTIKEIADVLKTSKSAVIFTHTRPDGDTIGCGVALSRALSFIGVKSEVVCDTPVPDKLKFITEIVPVKGALTLDADTYICVDVSDENRLGELTKTYLGGVRKKTTVNVDHHVSNTRFAKYNYVRDCSANCMNVLPLIEALGAPVDKDVATALMAGLLTDSGCFTHGDVDEETFKVASMLAEKGVKVADVYEKIYRSQTMSHAKLYATTVSKIRYELENRLAIAVVDKATMEKLSATPDMTEGIVDYALGIESVEVSVSLLEVRKNQYKASFRSRGKVNVNEVAGVYGGGGHVLASGCMLFGEIEEVVDRLRYTVYTHMGD